MHTIIDFILNIDTYLQAFTESYGILSYLLLFTIIFCETGLVIFPLLPGDSVLFAAGTLAAVGDFNIFILWLSLCIAAILGDALNFFIGSKLGDYVRHKKKKRIIKQKHIDETDEFFEKHGPFAVVLARFVPIVRTFAPFIAGASDMTFKKFLHYNIIGGVAWVSLFLFLGYFFGNIPFIQAHFELAMIAVIFISIIPIIVSQLKRRLKKN